jgi:hypothetical protein
MVLHLRSTSDSVLFDYGDPDEDARDSSLALDFGVWDEMGRPETITVMVEPGDKLNEEGSA